MVGVFSEFERSMISERVKLGLKRVKSKGTILGRPKSIDEDLKEKIWILIDEGNSYSQISKKTGISKMSISRVNKERLESV
jgi:DNA invertase Pin-like site-specific DNA recombinase